MESTVFLIPAFRACEWLDASAYVGRALRWPQPRLPPVPLAEWRSSFVVMTFSMHFLSGCREYVQSM
jgi:hypothetical protein